MYVPEAFGLKLTSIPTKGRTFEEVEADVRAACADEGIGLSTEKSSQAHDGKRQRYTMKKLTCQRRGTNRQALYLNSLDDGKLVMYETKNAF